MAVSLIIKWSPHTMTTLKYAPFVIALAGLISISIWSSDLKKDPSRPSSINTPDEAMLIAATKARDAQAAAEAKKREVDELENTAAMLSERQATEQRNAEEAEKSLAAMKAASRDGGPGILSGIQIVPRPNKDLAIATTRAAETAQQAKATAAKAAEAKAAIGVVEAMAHRELGGALLLHHERGVDAEAAVV